MNEAELCTDSGARRVTGGRRVSARLAWPGAALAVTVAFLAACTGPDGSPQPAPTPSGSAGAQAPAGTGAGGDLPAPSLQVPIDIETPFDAYLPLIGALSTRSAAQEESRRAWWETVEADVATCMNDAGFDYEPEPYPEAVDETVLAVFVAKDALTLPRLPDTRDEAARVGYGADDIPAAEAAREKAEAVGPNGAYYESLSGAAKSADAVTLTGSSGPDDPGEGGCLADAQTRHPDPTGADAPDAFLEQYTPLLALMHRIRSEDVNGHTRATTLNEQWATCMADAGFDIAPGQPGATSPTPRDALGLAIRTRPDGQVSPAEYDGLTSELPIEERYLLGSEPERAIALADFDCRAATDYEATLTDVLVELEAQFVRDHKPELDELAAAIELAG